MIAPKTVFVPKDQRYEEAIRCGRRLRIFSATHEIPMKHIVRGLGLSSSHVSAMMRGDRPAVDAVKALNSYMDGYEKSHREEV